MILLDFKDFVEKLPPRGRILGIDWGAKRVGLALSDEMQQFAFPKGTHTFKYGETGEEHAPDAGNIGFLISDEIYWYEENIVGVVIGFPTYLDGTESDTTARVREFADTAEKLWKKMPVTFLDEALSSEEAAIRYKHAGKVDRQKGLDAFAAAVILEDALAKIKRLRNDAG